MSLKLLLLMLGRGNSWSIGKVEAQLTPFPSINHAPRRDASSEVLSAGDEVLSPESWVLSEEGGTWGIVYLVYLVCLVCLVCLVYRIGSPTREIR